MGQDSSRELFVTMLKTMLKVRGVTAAKHKLEKFLLFVEEFFLGFLRMGL